MIASELKTGIPQEKLPTFPALYKHYDKSVYLFDNREIGFCVKTGNPVDFIGRKLDLGQGKVDESTNWKRLREDEEIVLKNTD